MKKILAIAVLFSYAIAVQAQGGHSWTTWRADLEVLAPTLFK